MSSITARLAILQWREAPPRYSYSGGSSIAYDRLIGCSAICAGQSLSLPVQDFGKDGAGLGFST
jgi:hypothetical protein